jgi:ribonuclease-3
MDTVRQFVEPLFNPELDTIMDRSTDKDAKSLFQEWSQATLGQTPIYRTVASTGPDHAKTFTVAVMIGAQEVGRGTGNSKQAAAQAAAQKALEAVESGDVVFDETG